MKGMSPVRRTTRRWTSRRRVLALVALTLGTAVPGACGGGGGGDAAFTPVVGSDSAYCATYRAWKVYELDHGEGFDQPNPAALQTFWKAYVSSEETLLRQAPPEIRGAVEVKVRFIRTRMTPVMEKYGFDLERIQGEGTPSEQAAVFQGPPADVRKAQADAYGYEDKACGTQPSPPPAEVVFTARKPSKRFCTAQDAFNRELDEIAASRFDPNVMRIFFTGDRFTALLDRLERTAPPEIAADVEAEAEWFRTRWTDVLQQYDYDLRKIYVDATPEDLAVFNRTHPDVLEHSSRNTAYEEQACGG
jgi:hypothetical protein